MDWEQRLQEVAERTVAQNRAGRDDFGSRSARLTSILMNGTQDDLNDFTDDLSGLSDGDAETREGSGEAEELGEAGGD